MTGLGDGELEPIEPLGCVLYVATVVIGFLLGIFVGMQL